MSDTQPWFQRYGFVKGASSLLVLTELTRHNTRIQRQNGLDQGIVCLRDQRSTAVDRDLKVAKTVKKDYPFPDNLDLVECEDSKQGMGRCSHGIDVVDSLEGWI